MSLERGVSTTDVSNLFGLGSAGGEVEYIFIRVCSPAITNKKLSADWLRKDAGVGLFVKVLVASFNEVVYS